MDKEEVRHLKLFLTRTNANKERKDIALFDYVRKSFPNQDEGRVLKKLYDTVDKNALYRLKNRLFEDISKSITLQYYNANDANLIIHNLCLSRHFQNKGHFKIAFHYINKAERKAKSMQSFELLDLIYSDFIKLSQETLSINPEKYIAERTANREKLYKIREIDDMLSVLIYRIKLSQNYSAKNKQVIDVLQKTIDDFAGQVDFDKNPHLRFRIYHAVSRILLQRHDYKSLEEYLTLTHEEFTKENLFTKNNHDTKLQMLTYLTNATFKLQKLEESLAYADLLHKAMKEHGSMYYDKYLSYYYNALVNNYSQLDKEKAIEILNDALKNAKIMKVVPHSRVIFNLNLALLYFAEKNYKQANKRIIALKLDDIFNSLDSAFQLKISIVELIIRYELEDHDYIEYQIANLYKDYKELLDNNDYERQKNMVVVLGKMIYAQNLKADEEVCSLIETLRDEISDEEASDSDILNYNEWLNNKIA